MSEIRLEAERLSSYGRHGDSELVHMSPGEVDVLASTGRLSVNPDTGLPEAFGLGDLFKGIGSIGAGILGTALGGPVGAALASGIFTGLAEKNVKKGLLSGMLGFAGGKALDSAVGATAGAWSDKLEAKDYLRALPGALSREGGEAAMGALTEGSMPFLLYPQIGNLAQSIDQDQGGGNSTYDRELAAARGRMARYFPSRSMYGQRIVQRYSGGGEVSKAKPREDRNQWTPLAPDGDPDFWDKELGRGQYGNPAEAEEWAVNTFPFLQSNEIPAGYVPGYHPEFQYLTPEGVTPDNPAEWSRPMGANPFDMGGIADILGQGMPRFLRELGYTPDPPPPTGGRDRGRGGVVDPTGFVARRYAGGGMIEGPGMGGMADSVPAVIADTGEPAVLSEGEFVVPADVVSMLGDGDTESGARVLEQLVAQVRQQKTGSSDQAPPLDLAMMEGI